MFLFVSMLVVNCDGPEDRTGEVPARHSSDLPIIVLHVICAMLLLRLLYNVNRHF